MEPLTTVTALSAIGATFVDDAVTQSQIAAASAAIREAAGQPIAPATTVTIRLVGTREQWLSLPTGPVRSVESVQLNGAPAVGWRLLEGRLWRAAGWQPTGEPAEVTIVAEVGYDECPADLLPLLASLVAGQKAAAADGFDPKRGMSYERIDDYQYGLRTGGDEIQSATELTERTRAMLAARFGGSAHVTGAY